MSDNDPQDVFLGRQPILDHHQQLFAYELIFRGASAGKRRFAGFLDGGQAAAADIVETFSTLALADALGPYPGFIKTDETLLSSGLADALPARAVVLEILDTVARTPETIARCEQLRQAGYILAAHVRPESPDIDGQPFCKLAEIIKVDTDRTEPECLRRLASAWKPLRKTLLAEKVENNEKMHLYHELGFGLFQGYYFAQPAAVEGKRLQNSETTLLRLLGLISQDADIAEIEAMFKQEPALTINLLRLTNSVGSGLTVRITSLRHAIALLGRRQLLRWLQLLLYSGTPGAEAEPLLQLAATRARLMELLVDYTPEVKRQGRGLIDQAFMVGILSLMPALLGPAAREALVHLPLASPILDALNERVGVLGDLLAFIEAFEEDAREKAAAVLQRLPDIDTACANACLARALGWANNLAR
jgi:EAL and modified HD-GYP domain-containing signal transduction protein